jgi:gamma-glutamyltranspeptidase
VEERATDREPHARLGRVHAIALRPDGTMTAVADPRSGGVGLVARPSP